MSAKRAKTTEVFVPGGMPILTYVNRAEPSLQRKLEAVRHNLCKLVTLTGATKSGKTVLVNRVFPRGREAIWVDGGSVSAEGDLWSLILEQANGDTGTETVDVVEEGTSATGQLEASAGLPLFAKAGAKGSLTASGTRTRATTSTLSKSPRASALLTLRRTRRPLIIDDFHYLDRTLQGSVIRALKPLVFEGCPIVCIAIPHRRYDAVKVEKEMTGRLQPIGVPTWTIAELEEIAHTGFPLLNVDVSSAVSNKLAREAYGSPHLMQEFCQRLAQDADIHEASTQRLAIDRVDDDLFRTIAAEMGKVIFDKLKRGPRQRSDRKQRPLTEGGFADTYEAVLRGLSKLAPGLQKVDYEQLRAAIRQLLQSDVPQAHEISRVLEKMSEIASSDEASTPVLDWDKEARQLHITDPFFAFVLKWGSL